MSSILEALRELERSRPRPADPAVAPELPETPRRATDVLIPVLGGSAIGVLVFALALRGMTLVAPPTPTDADAPPPADAAAAVRPSWLDTADAPRARLDGGTPADRAARPPARSTAAVAPADAAPAPAHHAASAGPIVLEAIDYSPRVPDRAATLRVNGRRVTLHQREAAEGVEVQLIQPDGVYVQRGSEVFLVTPQR